MAPDADAVAGLARRLGEAMARPGATATAVAESAGEIVADDGPPLGVRARADVPGVEGVSVTRRWDSEEPNAAEIALAPGLRLAEVEARLGAGRPLTRTQPGQRRVAIEGELWTALVALTEDGDIGAITVRRDV